MHTEIAVKVQHEPEKFGGMREGLSDLEQLSELRFNG